VEIGGLEAQSLEFERYGYFVMDRTGDGWRGVFKDMVGHVVAACTLKARTLDCVRTRG
jgi:hypothetical protein